MNIDDLTARQAIIEAIDKMKDELDPYGVGITMDVYNEGYVSGLEYGIKMCQEILRQDKGNE